MFGRGSRPSWLIVGLGNPGPAYTKTRHNLGARLVELLASEAGVEIKRTRVQARVADAQIEGTCVALAVPTTYMNDSGRAVARLVKKEGVPLERLVIVHDELDLAPGVVRLKAGGGLAGHNGLSSIAASLRSRDFLRVRIGVGKPPSKEEGAEHVLSGFTSADRERIDDAIARAREGVHVLIRDGLDAAQNLLHSA